MENSYRLFGLQQFELEVEAYIEDQNSAVVAGHFAHSQGVTAGHFVPPGFSNNLNMALGNLTHQD